MRHGKGTRITTNNCSTVMSWNPRPFGASIKVSRSMQHGSRYRSPDSGRYRNCQRDCGEHKSSNRGNGTSPDMGGRRTYPAGADCGVVVVLAEENGALPGGCGSCHADDAGDIRLATPAEAHFRSVASGPAYGARPLARCGNRLDAFPSGHAIHVGALASAAARWPRRQRNMVWLAGACLVATRVILLAHWTSDVLAGLAIGVAWLRRFTGYGWEKDGAVAAPTRWTTP
jgi:PAP2 superfamily